MRILTTDVKRQGAFHTNTPYVDTAKDKKLDLIKFAEGLNYTEINDDTLLELLDALTKANGNPSPK